MNQNNRYQNIKDQLNKYIANLEQSVDILVYSYEKCKGIPKKDNYTQEELDAFELLTSRYARTSDILIQKVLKNLYLVLGEDIKTLIDAAHYLEKLEIVKQSDNILNIRTLRNQIAHEYATEDLTIIFHEVVKSTPLLLEIINATKVYIAEKVEET